jgi:UDP-3-O-[3-hydroxymyristoyl] glucosamine N-acyltransferase
VRIAANVTIGRHTVIPAQADSSGARREDFFVAPRA